PNLFLSVEPLAGRRRVSVTEHRASGGRRPRQVETPVSPGTTRATRNLRVRPLGLAGLDRAVLYAVAGASGFRAGELATLTPESFALDADPPTVTLPAEAA